jgi:hypothetical protein
LHKSKITDNHPDSSKHCIFWAALKGVLSRLDSDISLKELDCKTHNTSIINVTLDAFTELSNIS